MISTWKTRAETRQICRNAVREAFCELVAEMAAEGAAEWVAESPRKAYGGSWAFFGVRRTAGLNGLVGRRRTRGSVA